MVYCASEKMIQVCGFIRLKA